MFEKRFPLTLPINGLQIFAMRHEPVVKTTDSTVLFLHGFGGNKVGRHGLFVDISSRLAELGIASLRFDFRGSGDSEGRYEEQTISSLVQDAEIFYDFLSPAPVIVIGTSMGGLIASLLAARKQVKALALLAPVFDAEQWKEEWQKVPPEASLVLHNDRLVSRRFFEGFFAIKAEDVTRGVSRQPLLCFTSLKDETLNGDHTAKYQKACPEGLFLTLAEADHTFSPLQERMRLIEKTVEWISQQAKGSL